MYVGDIHLTKDSPVRHTQVMPIFCGNSTCNRPGLTKKLAPERTQALEGSCLSDFDIPECALTGEPLVREDFQNMPRVGRRTQQPKTATGTQKITGGL